MSSTTSLCERERNEDRVAKTCSEKLNPRYCCSLTHQAPSRASISWALCFLLLHSIMGEQAQLGYRENLVIAVLRSSPGQVRYAFSTFGCRRQVTIHSLSRR